MWRGYAALGGLEVANTARVVGYARTSGCPLNWFQAKPSQGFLDSAGQVAGYDYSQIASAPWYDPDIPDRSSRFLGVHILSMDNVTDSTASSTVTQKVGNGARLGRQRFGSREVRFRAIIAARGEDALEYGYSWLQSVLAPDACGAHGTACGVADLAFFVDEPPTQQSGESSDVYQARVDDYRLYLHSAARTSGPFVVQRLKAANGRHVGRLIEFAITSEEPWVYGVAREISIPPVVPSLVADIAFNLITRPSAEIDDGTLVVSTNYSANPSLETDATDWDGSVASVSGSSPAAYATDGRVTGELAAVGTASYRARILGNGSTTASGEADLTIQHDVLLTAIPAGSRPSFAIWAAAVSVGGLTGAALNSITVTAQWRSAGGDVGSPVVIGTTTDALEIAGKAWVLDRQVVPATADRVRLFVVANVDWSSSATPAQNSDIRLYSDAAAVTVP